MILLVFLLASIGWNVSHQFDVKNNKLASERKYSIYFIRLDMALRSTFNQTMNTLNNLSARGRPYLTPVQFVTRLNEKLRKQKEDERIQREKILKEEIDLSASKERKAALAFRYIEEKKRLDAMLAKKREEREFTGKPNMGKTLKNWRRFQYHHPGKWVIISGNDKGMWSCCASFVKEGRGCQYTVHDDMAWQFK